MTISCVHSLKVTFITSMPAFEIWNFLNISLYFRDTCFNIYETMDFQGSYYLVSFKPVMLFISFIHVIYLLLSSVHLMSSYHEVSFQIDEYEDLFTKTLSVSISNVNPMSLPQSSSDKYHLLWELRLLPNILFI